MIKLIQFLLLLAILVVGMALGRLNPHDVYIDLWFYTGEWPLSAILAASFGVGGFVVGLFAFLPAYFKFRRRLGELQRKSRRASDEAASLRALTVKKA